MPQLDQVTFLSQFFWLCIFYFAFYFYIVKYFLPSMGRIYKIRAKKMIDVEHHYNLPATIVDIGSTYDKHMNSGLVYSLNLSNNNLSQANSWVKKESSNINQKNTKLYINSMAKRLMNNILQVSVYNRFGPTENSKARVLLMKLRNSNFLKKNS
jgi:hypothetical protein